MHFVVGADGSVVNASVGGSLPSADALACVAREVETWQFRATQGATEVNYPLTFQPPEC
jgi:hypothetical protein